MIVPRLDFCSSFAFVIFSSCLCPCYYNLKCGKIWRLVPNFMFQQKRKSKLIQLARANFVQLLAYITDLSVSCLKAKQEAQHGLKGRERLEFQRDSLFTPLPNLVYFAFLVMNQDTGLIAADNPPQYLWFPFKGSICCKLFLDEICREGESCVRGGRGASQSWSKQPVVKLPTSGVHLLLLQSNPLTVGGNASQNLSQRHFPGLGNCCSAPLILFPYFLLGPHSYSSFLLVQLLFSL